MTDRAGLGTCVIGLGSMGIGIAASLLRAGFAVTGYDVSPDAMATFSALGGQSAGSPSAAAKGADVVLCVVVNAAQTETVLFGPHGAVATMLPGGVILSCATMAPDAARAHPTEEHFLPLLVAMGAGSGESSVQVIEGGITYGVLSMESYVWGMTSEVQSGEANVSIG